MKIYSVTGTVMSGGYVQFHWHYSPTLKEAYQHISEYDWVDKPVPQIEELEPTRKGVSELLNNFISSTCINE